MSMIFSENSEDNWAYRNTYNCNVVVYGKRNIIIECKNLIIKADDCILIGVKNKTIEKTIKVIPWFRLVFDLLLLFALMRGMKHVRSGKSRTEK